VQFIPPVAAVAGQVEIFQRTPPWFLPVPNYRQDVPKGMRQLMGHLPQLANWDRLSIFARTQTGLLPLAVADPEWDGGPASVSAANDTLRALLTGVIERQVADPDLRRKLLPEYPPLSKRIILDDGTYLSTLQLPHVAVEDTPIASMGRTGIRTEDGREHPADVVIYGTGFLASRFVAPMEVIGVGGRDLQEHWDGDARAYLGMTVPGFPNLFLMYGPNTNIVANGSITYFAECQTYYITEAVRTMVEGGYRALDCRGDVHDRYNQEIDAGNAAQAWGAAHVHTWYRNARGRISQNWPFDLTSYWRRTKECDVGEYHAMR